MVPGLKEWRGYTALEKVTYVAQALVLPTLAVTFVFSFLTWKEAKAGQKLAKAAQEQERSFFIAQNPPQLELTTGRVLDSPAGSILFLYIKNVGESAARSPCAEIRRLEEKTLTETMLTTNCTPDDLYADATLPKGEGVTYHIPQKTYLPFKPKRVIILQPDEPHPSGATCDASPSDNLLVDLRFRDILGEQRQIIRQVILCG